MGKYERSITQGLALNISFQYDINDLSINVIYFFTNYPFLFSNFCSVDQSNGQSQQETSELRQINPEAASIAVRGSYSYIAPDGVTYTVNYVADENGFRPEGAHIPQA